MTSLRARTTHRTIDDHIADTARYLDSSRPGDCIMKHSGSSMPDLEIQLEYDDAARTVTLTSNAFDSTLVCDFAVEHLPQAGIIVFADETGGPRVPGARWQLMYSLAGVLYECEVALQANRATGVTRRATARLSPR